MRCITYENNIEKGPESIWDEKNSLISPEIELKKSESRKYEVRRSNTENRYLQPEWKIPIKFLKYA